ncbi:MAG: Oligopeptide-binding protein OppA [Chlamydiia bacterium]|nr:Oligopeptide-binding protein OppA [Chlamydiia bacterium]
MKSQILKVLFAPLLATLLTVGLTTGCSSKSNNKKRRASTGPIVVKEVKSRRQELRVNIVSEPQSLDSRKAHALVDINLVKMFMEGLVRPNLSGEVELALAESYTYDTDHLTYTFKLKDAEWSNGDPITANDFVYTWKKALSPQFSTDSVAPLFVMKNAKAIKNGELPASMLGVEAVDQRTLVITLEAPTPYFFNLLSQSCFFPINSGVDKNYPHWAQDADHYVSSGPFILEEWKHSNELVARKNPFYWDAKKVKLDKILMMMVDTETGFKMFESGQIDIEGSPFSYVPTDAIAGLKEHNQINVDPILGTYWIRVNTKKEWLNKSDFRKALAFAIDRREIVDHVTLGEQIPTTGIIPVSMGIQKAPYFCDGDQASAKHLLQNVLDSHHGRGARVPEITLIYGSNERNHRLAQAIQDQWYQALGIEIRLERLENKVFFDRLYRQDYQLACGNWIADFDDPINFLEVFKTETIGTNNTGWESPNYIAAIEESYRVQDEMERKDLLTHCEQIIMEDMPVIPLFQATMIRLQHPRVKDVAFTNCGQIDFKWASINASTE